MKIIRLGVHDPAFPEVLLHIHTPPQALYVLGDLEAVLSQPRLAVVGSRKVTPYGCQVTMQLTRGAAKTGVAIISGLAIGVDTLAHEAALEAQGLTMAVLAGGLDRVSPTSNYNLAKRILASGGALISEYPPGTPPYRQNFIARNRLIAALSNAVMITEAAAQSGSLHTAKFALEQGSAVMAVPGNINAPYSEGTNNLIKAGAIPITRDEDILIALDIPLPKRRPELFGANAEEAVILHLIQKGIFDASELLALSRLDPALFNQTLTMLEITGKIRSLAQSKWSLT